MPSARQVSTSATGRSRLTCAFMPASANWMGATPGRERASKSGRHACGQRRSPQYEPPERSDVEVREHDVQPAQRVARPRSQPARPSPRPRPPSPRRYSAVKCAIAVRRRQCRLDRPQPLARTSTIRRGRLLAQELLERHGYHRRMAAVEQLVEELERSYAEVQERLSDPAVYNDHREAAEVGRRLKELEGPHRLAQEWRQAQRRPRGRARRRRPARARPRSRAAARRARGGAEAGARRARPGRRQGRDRRGAPGRRRRRGRALGGRRLPHADPLRRASRLSHRDLSVSENEAGGFKEVVFAVKGDGAYSVFKYEGGTHRVQRVPETESQGRIHTSTATVAVMPEAEDIEVEIDDNDLKIDVYRSTGPGGQSVNTTDSAVRITHLPTRRGRVHAGREVAAAEPSEGDARAARAAATSSSASASRRRRLAARRSQIGSGERAEKIRTYNFPENRAHRPPRQADGAPARPDPARRARRLHRRAAGRGPPARARDSGGMTRPGRRSSAGARPAREPRARRRRRLDAELLLGHALGLERVELYTELRPAARPSDELRSLRPAASATRAPRAGRVHPRRVGLPAADAARRPPCARSRGPRPRSWSSAASRCSTALDGAARARRRRRARARSRWRSPTSTPARA